MKTQFKKESFFSVSKRELFEFHEREDAFSLLTPDSEDIQVLSTASTLAPSDDVVRFVISFLLFKFYFEMVHTVYEPFDLFVDEQRKGLFSMWRHQHRFTEGGWNEAPASMLRDEITYAHPLLVFFDLFVKRRLAGLFGDRHRITAEEVHRGLRSTGGAHQRCIVVTGATGLIGKRVTQILVESGADVVAFVRDVEGAKKLLGDQVTCVHWDFDESRSGDWRRYLTAADGVIHLAGTPLFKSRWTTAFKRKMEESRVLGTRQLVDAIIESDSRPPCFVSASALGIYGTDPDRTVDERSPAADDLLSRICVEWENEAKKLDSVGVRNVQIRIGIVLSTEAGALKELLPLFRMGIGGTMGHPHPFINWIHLEDMARILIMALRNDQMHGPYNAVAPRPVRNREFAKAIARALKRPALMRFPSPVLRLIIGEAGEYASGGPQGRCDEIRKAGYRFFFEDLDSALENLLSR